MSAIQFENKLGHVHIIAFKHLMFDVEKEEAVTYCPSDDMREIIKSSTF